MKKNLLLALAVLFLVHFSNAQIPNLWGIASLGGAHSNGAIIKINGNGSGFTPTYAFNGTDGSFPGGHLVLNGDGMFYGMTFNGGAHNSGNIFRINPATNAYADLYDIDSLGESWTNSDLVRANDSLFYGLIYTGGADSLGQLFSFNIADSVYTVLYHFSLSTGANPRNFMMATDHKLYGINDNGGADSVGTLFSYDPATNTYTDLHDFDSTRATGAPVQATDGKLYGLTNGGGVASWGSIYSYDPLYTTYTKLYDFDSLNAIPGWINSLIQASDGKLYGASNQGGSSGLGAIFSFDPTGNVYSTLYNFTTPSGTNPVGSMIQASDGKLYGMTNTGGAHAVGTIFSFDLTDSAFFKMKDLTAAQGDSPYGSLTELPAGTGFAEHTLSEQIQAYPNPVSNQLILHTSSPHTNGEITVSIMNALGEYISVEQRAWETDLSFDTKRLSSGIYFIQIKNASESWVGKFVKE